MSPVNDPEGVLVRERLSILTDIATPTDAVWAEIVARASSPQLDVEPPRSHRGRWVVGTIAAAAVVVVSLVALLSGHAGSPTNVHTGGSSTTVPARVPGTLAGTVTISQQGNGDPMLCGGLSWVVGSSCEGIPVDGWDWNAVPGATTTGGVRSGRYQVTGRMVDGRFQVTHAATPATGPPTEAPATSPCSTTTVTDPTKETPADNEALLDAARQLPDYAGDWFALDPGANPSPFDPSKGVTVIALSGPVSAHRAELEALWGGRLCLDQVVSSISDLTAVEGRLDDFAQQHDLRLVSMGIDARANRVVATVLVASDGSQAAADDAFGPGVVRIAALLQPT